jgi:hypothetical protein
MRTTAVAPLVLSGIVAILALSGAPANAKTLKQCNAEYAANKAAVKASGQTKADYVTACRAEASTPPAATTSAPNSDDTAPAKHW